MSWNFKTGFVSCITPLWRAELDWIFCRCGTLCNQLQDMLDKPAVATGWQQQQEQQDRQKRNLSLS